MKFNLDLGFGNLVVAGVAETSPLPLSLSFQWGPERREIRLIGDADLSFRSRFPLLPSAAALQVIIKCVHTHTHTEAQLWPTDKRTDGGSGNPETKDKGAAHTHNPCAPSYNKNRQPFRDASSVNGAKSRARPPFRRSLCLMHSRHFLFPLPALSTFLFLIHSKRSFIRRHHLTQ